MNRVRTTHIVIHCAATRASQDIGSREIDQWHKAKGWQGCGYHAVIRRNGDLETRDKGFPTRRWSEVGAHVEGQNATSVGICLAGGVAADGKTAEANFTEAQYGTLRELLGDLMERYPGAQVLGHRDFPGVHKDCPSFDVRSWLAANPPRHHHP